MSGRFLVNSAKILGTAVLIKDHVVEAAFCTGESMEPTINSRGDIILISKFNKWRFNCNSIVVTISPTEPKHLICKRVLGLPGDTVWMFDSVTTVPKGHIWLQGDNAYKSLDSRAFGPVPIGLIQGLVVCKVYINVFSFGR